MFMISFTATLARPLTEQKFLWAKQTSRVPQKELKIIHANQISHLLANPEAKLSKLA